MTETRLRPLARRREITARPLLVFIRTRNPWVFERRRRLGWNVRLGIERIYSLCRSPRLVDERKSINDSRNRSKLLRLRFRARGHRRSVEAGAESPTRGARSSASEIKLHNSCYSYQVAT